MIKPKEGKSRGNRAANYTEEKERGYQSTVNERDQIHLERENV